MTSLRPLLGLLAIPALLGAPRPADACSPPPCWPGAFVPGDGAIVPANVPALYWRPVQDGLSGPADPANVVLATQADPDTPLPFTATELPDGHYLLVPDAPLVEGTAYVLDDRNTCLGATGPRVTFSVGPAAALPESLGTLDVLGHGVRGALEVGTASGSCSTTIDAVSIQIALAPVPGTQPWMPMLLVETLVDGQVWRPVRNITVRPPPGESWIGRGVDRLFRACASDDPGAYTGLGPGGHQVAMRATLPGVASTLGTAAIPVELMCDPPADDPDDPGVADCACATGPGDPAGLLVLGVLAAALRPRRRGRLV